jgi:hAT family protein
MASSVLSERAFSSAGITISKRRNHLKKDIVEALQCLKCMYHNNLIFHEVETVVDEEKAMDKDLEVNMDNEVNNLEEGFFWDQAVIDIDEN